MALLWTQKQDVGPAGRIFPSMTFDAARGRVVLFGGQVAGGDPTADTWVWDGADWTQVSDMGPSARAAGAMAFDAARERAVLFGGVAEQAFRLRAPSRTPGNGTAPSGRRSLTPAQSRGR